MIGFGISVAVFTAILIVWAITVRLQKPNPLHTRFNNDHIEGYYRQWKGKGK